MSKRTIIPSHRILPRWIAREICQDSVGIGQIKYLENRVGRRPILPFYDGIFHTHLLGRQVVLKNGPAVEAEPSVLWTGNREFNIGVTLHLLVDGLGAVGAEP